MPRRAVEILLVDGDEDTLPLVEEALQPLFPVHVSWAPSCSEALCEELTHRHDLIICGLELPDSDGLTVVRELRTTNRCPAILLADAISPAQAIAAMRLGVRDVLMRPPDPAELANAVHQAVRRHMKLRRQARRNRRLRLLTARILRERRDLRQRIDLICQDVVQAYRRLAQNVAETRAAWGLNPSVVAGPAAGSSPPPACPSPPPPNVP